MKLLKLDVPSLAQALVSGMNGEGGRQVVHRRPASLMIRAREIDCVLADIQAKILMLRRERTYLRLVRRELGAPEVMRNTVRTTLRPVPW